MKYDAVIIGAGPGGLRCASLLAGNGVHVLVLERNKKIGRKVCAGGITWGGLINSLPDTLIQKKFSSQKVRTRYQNILVCGSEPLIATVNRSELGLYMAERAADHGAEIILGGRAEVILEDRVRYTVEGRSYEVHYDFLVGADGSSSKVRKFLGIDESAPQCGIGIHYLVSGAGDDMVWNFNADIFGSGYSWVFPHRHSASVGAYLGDSSIPPHQLKKRLDEWLDDQGIELIGARFEADKINIDYRGWSFGPRFLIGDAAGLASPLTGEGINPAIVSAEAVASKIIDDSHVPNGIERIISKHRKHQTLRKTAGRSRLLSLVLSELSGLLLRTRIIGFDKFEMA